MQNAKKSKPKHLGRGLQSLLGPITSGPADTSKAIPIAEIGPNIPLVKELGTDLRLLNLGSIKANPYQPRTKWDEQELSDLAESVKVNGVIQPIIVRPSGAFFEIIAGERRFRAAKLASLITIPAVVRQATDEQMLELALVENIHRTNLNPIERAKAYHSYINSFSLTQGQAAERLGEDRSVLANYIRLLDLPQEIRNMLIEGQLAMGHARAILALPTDQLRHKLANRAMAGRLSVREVERLVRSFLTNKEERKRTKPEKAPHIADLERKLTNELGTRVTIETRKNKQRGKIVIEFYSLDEFDRITERIGISSNDEA